MGNFPEWLQAELDSREWTQADLARKAELSRTAISRAMNGERIPGVGFCKGVARAFGMRDIDVMRHAGLADPEDPPSDVRERVKRQLDQMTDEQLRVVELIARALLAEQILESIRAEPQKPQTNPHLP